LGMKRGSCCGEEALVSGFGGRERDLLLEDQVDERGETRFALPKRRRPEILHNPGEVFVAPHKEFQAVLYGLLVENNS